MGKKIDGSITSYVFRHCSIVFIKLSFIAVSFLNYLLGKETSDISSNISSDQTGQTAGDIKQLTEVKPET